MNEKPASIEKTTQTTVNRTRAAKIMKREKLKALLATTPENVTYVSGTPLRANNWTMQIYALLPEDEKKRPCLILPTNRLCVIAQAGIPDADIYLYGEFYFHGAPSEEAPVRDVEILYNLLENTQIYADPLAALTAALKNRGLDKEPLGIDEMRIAPELYARLKKALPVYPAYKLFREIREIKTSLEMERLRKVAKINEQAEQELISLVAGGVHESELAEHYRISVMKQGAVPAMVAVGAGPRSAVPLIEYYYYRIQSGDLVRFDLCCQLDGYWSDTGRTVVAEHQSDWQKRYFNAIHCGWEHALGMIRPGVKASDIFQDTVQVVRNSGIPHYRRQHVGHSIGLEIYDGIVLAPNDHRVLEEGMVFCVEVPYYEFGLGGFQVEDTVVVTKNGFEFLTGVERKLF